MKNLKKNRLDRDQLKYIFGGGEQHSSLDGKTDFASCVADCGNGSAAVCQGGDCWATDLVGCGVEPGVTLHAC